MQQGRTTRARLQREKLKKHAARLKEMADGKEPDSLDWLPGGLIVRDRLFTVPLVHPAVASNSATKSSYFTTETLTVFARECVHSSLEKRNLPWALFLQGGPGFPSPRPRDNSGWIKRFTQEFRLLLLDQRGTGRSSLVNHQSLARFESDEEKAEYLTYFRQDSIVHDCEIIRRELLGEGGKWVLYGQSFGGFCILSYLSIAPESISMALFTGGIPPVLRSPEEVYRETFLICLQKNYQYYDRYPGDVKRVQDVVRYIRRNEVRLPNGDLLTVRRLRSFGLNFYGSGGFEVMHWLFEDVWVDGKEGVELSYKFLSAVQSFSPFETNPLYSLLHEQIYVSSRASNWAAHRIIGEFAQYSRDDSDNVRGPSAHEPGHAHAGKDGEKDQPFIFTGEMVFPWMFEDFGLLRPLKGVADILSQKSDWPTLYDVSAIRRANVPCAAVIYYEDMCVVRKFSEETVSLMPNVTCWITNEYEHNGSSVDGERIISKLLSQLKYK